MRTRWKAFGRLLRFLLQRREVFLHSGLERASGQPLSVLTTQCQHSFNRAALLGRMLDGEAPAPTSLGHHRLISFRPLLSRFRASLACVEIPLSLDRLFGAVVSRGSPVLLVPWFVESVVDLSSQAESHWSNTLRRDLQKMERKGYSYSVSTEREHFKVFVNDYWRPLIDRRFGGGAADMGYEHLIDPASPAQVFQDLQLLRVFKDGRWASAMLLRTRPSGIPELLEVGVRNGEAELVDAGAQTACYWALFAEVRRRGYNGVSLMWCFPDLAGGTFRYKLRFRPLIRRSKYPLGVVIMPGPPSQAAESFLLNHPLIQLKRGRLTPSFFSDSSGQIIQSKDLLEEGRLRGLAAPQILPVESFFARREDSGMPTP